MPEILLPDATHCPFCDYLRGSASAVFVARDETVSVLLNPRQYERGALLVIPNRHVATLIDAADDEFLAVQLEARRMAALLVRKLDAQGINVYQNAGSHAGQTVAHYHVHVVPRYKESDPRKQFREADFEITPREQLEALADRIGQ